MQRVRMKSNTFYRRVKEYEYILENTQRGDYYVELECDQGSHGRPGLGECEGSAFITILGR